MYLVLQYPFTPTTATLLQVTEEDYKSCNRAKPIEKYEPGCFIVVFHRPGPFYFIDGGEKICENGQKFMMFVKPKHKDGFWSRLGHWFGIS